MIDFFCKIYSSIQEKNAFLTRIRFYSLLRALTRLNANAILPLYFKSTGRNRKYSLSIDSKSKTPVIVSLTSFPARINRLWLVIECMLRQAIKPDRIILWLSKKQFSDMQSIPKNLLKLQTRGLEIRIVDGDLRSHKKYIYAMQEYPETCIITIDDDIFYPTNTLSHLMRAHENNYCDVIANVAHRLCYTPSGELLPYNEWRSVQTPDCTDHILQVGIGGVLYPPHCAHTDICNPELAYELCPHGDDLWLYAMCKLHGTTIRKSASAFVPLPIYNIHNMSLSSLNLQGRNDVQIKQLTDYCIKQYGVNPFAK